MPSSTAAGFGVGDRVSHPAKPEWGPGVVVTAQTATQDGKPCQRLQIRFDKAGLKTISTAFVALRAVTASWIAPEPGSIGSERDPAELLARLPEPATDPFSPVAARLRATLALYTHAKDGPGLIAWATALTGLSDPLSRFNRHELEERFARWRVLLDQHLGKLLGEARSVPAQEMAAIAAQAPEPGREALKRANRRR